MSDINLTLKGLGHAILGNFNTDPENGHRIT